MPTYLLRWQGPKRTEQCRQYLQSVIGAWQMEWSAGAIDSVSISSAPAVDVSTNHQWRRVRVGQCTVLLAIPNSALAAWGQKMLDLGRPDIEGVCERIAHEAVTDLMARLGVSELGREPTIEMLALPPDDADLAECHGNVGFVMLNPIPQARLFVNAVWCDEYVPIQESVKLPALGDRRAAIGSINVEAKSTLELGALSIQDSLELSVGEVLLTDAKTDSVALLSVSGRDIAGGTLANNHDSRALRLTELFAS